MALFRKKPPNSEGDGSGDGAGGFAPQPEKARKWFDHAKTAAMASNYGYALACYASGIRLDPATLSAHESMLEAAVRYHNQGEKPATGKEVRAIDDGTPIGKFAAAEFEWMKDLRNYKAAMRLLEAAAKAEQHEIGHYFAPRVAKLLQGQKKVSKAVLLQAMEVFRSVGAWDQSMAAGQMAYQLDPTDSDLDAELKNLSAQRAMDQGGYDAAGGEEGGFRKFIRDADRQQELVEGDAIAVSKSVEERNLERARAAYQEAPNVPEAINRYAQLLKKAGTEEGEAQALAIYEQGFANTGEYRFRMAAGDIRIERLERRMRELDERLAAGDDDDLRAERERLHRELLELKTTEYTERVAKYPTDRFRKFELGLVGYDLGQYQDAMAQFQAAKDEPKLRVRAGHMLGRCFLAEEWYAEAISEFEDALPAAEIGDKERELMIRYDLMVSLLAAARLEGDVEMAKRAREICSDIARRDITYRDIRARRGETEEVIRELTAKA